MVQLAFTQSDDSAVITRIHWLQLLGWKCDTLVGTLTFHSFHVGAMMHDEVAHTGVCQISVCLT